MSKITNDGLTQSGTHRHTRSSSELDRLLWDTHMYVVHGLPHT